MRVWIFSDLHLTNSTSPLYQGFIKALAEPHSPDHTVVFAGDIFDLLIGNSQYYREKYPEFFNAVDVLASNGVKLHYIEGNHDFHLEKLFPAAMQFHDEAVIIQDPNTKKLLYIAHGDLVDEKDDGYILLRKLLRSKTVQFLSSKIPGQAIEKIGEHFSRPLEQKSRDLPEYATPENRHLLREVFHHFAQTKRREGYDFIVLGHCHDFDEIPPFYFNMGYPPVHGRYVYYGPTKDGEPGLQRSRFPE